MSEKYIVTHNGQERIPIANGTYSTSDGRSKNLDENFDDGVFIIAFYNSSGQPVTPTGGTITPEMSPIDGQWQAPSNSQMSIEATSVKAGSATYTIPRFRGIAIAGRFALSGITGADHCRAFFWRTRQNNNQ